MEKEFSSNRFSTNDQKYRSQLVYDYHLLTSLRKDLDKTILELEND